MNNTFDYLKIGNYIEELWKDGKHFKSLTDREIKAPQGLLYDNTFSTISKYMLNLAKVLKSNLSVEEKKQYLRDNIDSIEWPMADALLYYKMDLDLVDFNNQKNYMLIPYDGEKSPEALDKVAALNDSFMDEFHFACGSPLEDMCIDNGVVLEGSGVMNTLGLLCKSVNLPNPKLVNGVYTNLTAENFYNCHVLQPVESREHKR